MAEVKTPDPEKLNNSAASDIKKAENNRKKAVTANQQKISNPINNTNIFQEHVMTDAIKENIETMLGQISNEDYTAAQETFGQIITDKVAQRLENMKVDVANEYFNGVQEEIEVE